MSKIKIFSFMMISVKKKNIKYHTVIANEKKLVAV